VHTLGGASNNVDVVSSLAKNVLFVDRDTDNDGIGNKEDLDDDGDGTSDIEEVQSGTDPLVKNIKEGEKELKDEEKTKDIPEPIVIEKPQGLEQYIENDTTKKILTNLTDTINETKQSLDTYRRERKEPDLATSTEEVYELLESSPFIRASSSLSRGLSSFGDVTRSKATTTPKNSEGFWSKVFGFFGGLFDSAYTVALSTLSLVLGHPVLVQVGILVLILYLIIHYARKLGDRRER
jgi:hypothetical protein